MKKILLILAFIGGGLVAPAQSIDQKHVPSIVVNAFQLKFPKATGAEWKLERGFYKVGFQMGPSEYEAFLDYMGRLKRLKQQLDAGELPAAVTATIAGTFNGYSLYNLDRIEEGQAVVYKMTLKNGSERRKVTFSPQGKILENKTY